MAERTIVYRPRDVLRTNRAELHILTTDHHVVGARILVLFKGLRLATVQYFGAESLVAVPDDDELTYDVVPADLADAVHQEQLDGPGYCTICGAHLDGPSNWGHDPRRVHVLWHASNGELPPTCEQEARR